MAYHFDDIVTKGYFVSTLTMALYSVIKHFAFGKQRLIPISAVWCSYT